MKKITTRLKRMFGRENPAPRSAKCQPTEQRTTASTRLYRCEACDITFVSEEMESCPKCCETLEQIPSGKELGIYNPE